MTPLGPMLRKAADEFLATAPGWDSHSWVYSCDAVRAAFKWEPRAYRAIRWLKSLGVNVKSRSEFDEIGSAEYFDHSRQSVRFAWLHFAADIADEWGIEV